MEHVDIHIGYTFFMKKTHFVKYLTFYNKFSGSEVLYGEVLSTTLISDVKSMGTKGEKINFHVSPYIGEGLLAGVWNERRR